MRSATMAAARAVLGFCLLVLIAPTLATAADDAAVIETETGSHEFTVEMAVTPSERARGLMYRQSLAPDRGMLFDFGRDQEVGMWMRNTYISLDMIFIEADGNVRRIARATTPFSTETVSSRGPVRAVLEISAGGADRIGLKAGDTVRHSMFGNAD